MITVNNFFAHFIREISVTKYESDKELIPIFSLSGIYQYSDAKLKKRLLYSKKPVYYNDVNLERRIDNGDGITTTGMNATQTAATKKNYTKDLKIDDRITKFKE